MNILTEPTFLKGTITPPASKSYLHRALIAASLAREVSVIKEYTLSNDIIDTINVLRSLGTEIEIGDTLVVKPMKWRNNQLSIKESGTTYRLMIPILSSLFSAFQIEVDESLYNRPVTEYEKMGLIRNGFDHKFELNPGEFVIDGAVSSQFVSGLLMALPLFEEDSVIHFENPSSINYVLMTIQVLNDFGIEVEQKNTAFYIKGNQQYKGTTYVVEPDFSSIAFWAVAGLINGDIFIKAPEVSLQPDYEIINLIKEIGQVDYKDGFIFKKQSLKPFDISIKNCPDLAPALAVLGSYINGVSIIRDVDRLVYKESNRLDQILKLNNIGGRVDFNKNLFIDKAKFFTSEVCQKDHRIGMMYCILPISMRVRNVESIGKSYPGFIKDYQTLGGLIYEYN